MRTLLVTGGAGFIGSNFVRHMLTAHSDVQVVNYDLLTYAGNLRSLADLENERRHRFLRGDIRDRARVRAVLAEHGVDAVVHFAAESHVDRSIMGAGIFAETNVVGTQVLLDASREHGVQRFVHVSTDEVYGSLGPTGKFTEETPLHPNSPYAASKAGSDLLALASHHTYDFPVIVTRCSNNYGPYQFPEKLIPLMIANAIDGKRLPVYGDGLNIRDWLHVQDHCTALDLVLQRGTPGEVYNIGGDNEWTNIAIIKLILGLLGASEELIQFVRDRPGHDRRYAIDAGKIQRQLGWTPRQTFEQGLRNTVEWYRTHEAWWRDVISGEYQEYYRKMYDGR